MLQEFFFSQNLNDLKEVLDKFVINYLTFLYCFSKKHFKKIYWQILMIYFFLS